jgi:peptidyl-prolyl cis-trans isomerase D
MLDGIRRNAQSWMIKALFAVIIVVFVFAFGMGGMGGGGKGNTLALVNERPIKVDDFRRNLEQSLEAMRQRNPEISRDELEKMNFRQQVLQQMINRELLMENARDLGLFVTPAELRRNISEIPAFQNESRKFDPRVYRRVLSANRLSPGEFESGMAGNLLIDKLRGYIVLPARVTEGEVRDFFDYVRTRVSIDYLLFDAESRMPGVQASEEEILAYYENNSQKFTVAPKAAFDYLLFTPSELAQPEKIGEEAMREFYENNRESFIRPEAVKARHILVQVDEDAPEEEVQKAQNKLLTAEFMLHSGKDFAQVAEAVSEGPSASQGGDLGWFSRGSMVEAFEDKAFSMEPGEVSNPVRTRFGFHIIKVEDRRAEQVKTFEQAREEIRLTLAEERATERLTEVLDGSLEQLVIGGALRQVATDQGLELKSSGMLTQSALASKLELEPEEAAKLFDLAQGQPTESPVETEQGYILAVKTGAEPASVRPLEEVREAVTTAVRNQKAMELAEKDARDALDAIKTSGDPAATIEKIEAELRTSEPVGRGDVVPELGMNPGLLEDVFASEAGSWLPGPYRVNKGYVLARPAERVKPKDETWAAEKQFWMSSLLESKKEEIFQAHVASLYESAEVKLVSPEYINK